MFYKSGQPIGLVTLRGLMMIRVVVASARTAIRNALKMAIEADPTIIVVGEAATGRELADLSDRLEPEVIFVDSSSGGFEGFRVFGRRRTGVVLISDATGPLIPARREVPVAMVDPNARMFDLTDAIRGIIESADSYTTLQ
jgi:DNA-binding NarL/FixJ family response regulator